jgi:hypothetical protein
MGINDLKARLADVPGIDGLTMQTVMGRQVFGIGGKLIGVDLNASEAEIDNAIRVGVASPDIATIIPPVTMNLAPEAPKGSPAMTATMTAPAPGSFAASLRAMMDEARAGVAQARADGLSKVTDAVGKLAEAKAATTHVSEVMAKTIADEADAVMAELGQISNSLGGENL